MICFPNIKINIGLNIISKRTDGYHNIETVFYPVPYNDILEILPSEKFEFVNEGIKINCPVEQNLCYKAFKLLQDNFNIGPVKIILYKNVPFGTGLGSGSSDAAHTLLMLNNIFDLKINDDEMIRFASAIGADCAFFIMNKPLLASGIGNIFNKTGLSLKDKYITICLPEIHVNTSDAYKNINCSIPGKSLSELIKLPLAEWKDNIKNDFEIIVFKQFPVLNNIKSELYNNGAVYAQMSGSGSAVFGIFEKYPVFTNHSHCKRYKVIKL